MSSIHIRIDGDRQRLMKQLQKMGSIDIKGLNKSIAEGLRTSTMERFRIEKDPEGKKWKTSIRAQETGGKTLTKTAKLKTSIRSTASAGGFAVGTNDIRAATLQFGDERTIRPRRGPVLKFKIDGRWISAKEVHIKIPARPFLGISEDDDKQIKKALEEALEEG